ncbi:MAG: chemotaxis response regulator protein-glutamate methylesterase [Pseudomonas sp.]|uniref:protein-glutamate methylesterase/protein-glutamine glutaminase n=1 Tax=Pseudomonas sp. TaxID=306 RepID=UPI00121084EA|nr:chemotaxis response regulator protein-glutamate methylesterase [Pseudomonas sp.]RZI67200.1 MAG: chemotaxis response regulator protein-glutamate methylesterase [Pseudomonas sp.]
MKKIRVLIVDDSALIRQVLSAIVNSRPDMEVAATAAHPMMARDLLRTVEADVMTLDVEMPMMNGIDFLRRLMAARPMPVVMVSTLTAKGSEMTLQALELGAIDFICKPKLGVVDGLQGYAEDICAKLRTAAAARVPGRAFAAARNTAVQAVSRSTFGPCGNRIILIGSSTGGTEAVRELLMRMPADSPPMMITQHMPENFTRSFAQRLDNVTHFSVCEAEDGQPAQPGQVFIAPGHSHLMLQRSVGGYVTRLSKADPVNRHRPSVDVLFHSAAHTAGASAIGIILTGMGKDGAAGMLAMHQAGAMTFAQDEQTCVVFGMPREAIALGGVDVVASLSSIAQRLCERVQVTRSK